jgi:hypothetical protein
MEEERRGAWESSNRLSVRMQKCCIPANFSFLRGKAVRHMADALLLYLTSVAGHL